MYSGHRLSPWLSHVMASEEESQRPLLTPDEALRLPDDATLVFRAGHRPIYAEKLRYFEDPRLLARARMPAPRASDRIAGAAGGISSSQPAAIHSSRARSAITAPHGNGANRNHRNKSNGSADPSSSRLPDTEELLE